MHAIAVPPCEPPVVFPFHLLQFISNQSHQNTLHVLNAHIDVLDHSPVGHCCGNMPPTTFLLEVSKALQDDAFTVGESVSDVWQVITRITAMHIGSTLIGWDLQGVVLTP
jgi:hypothetical protein